ncbi:multidrug efflux system outer membrane protein [Catalinimonas alkaloidigena]|uniref:efflux transporter outer membrane subunit n=1 Tax=Catalinimonas alkaloidigena TaxID=1075417 RepID=UPI0024056860|nr:TolC family protein [Catalinimonas alkaloidigena]MDF9797350.1 multidrug efflux system outer membrane protein [Catalinimonas alkaloidigena]
MRFSKQIIPFSLILITAIGCKVGESYKRPDVGKADSYYGLNNQRDSVLDYQSNLSDINWRDYFEDSTLISLIDTALTNNIDLRKSSKQNEISYQNLQLSKANFYPSFGFSPLEYNREYYSENYNNYGSNRARRNHGEDVPTTLYTERSAYALAFFASWEIDIWGKFKWQKEAARASYMQSEEFQKAVQTALVADIASTYYNMLMIRSQIAVAERNLELGRRTLNIVKLQFDADETTSLAIQQTESQILRAESLIPRLERDYIILENQLNQLLGRYPQPIDIEQNLEDVVFVDRYSTGVPVDLINNRPDVAAAEYQLIVSNAKVGITQAMKYPSIVLRGSAGLNSFQFQNFLDPMGSGFALINGALFQPLFQNRKLKTNHLIAVTEKQIAELDFKDKFILAVRDVSDALITIEKLQEEYGIAEERIAVTSKGVQDASLLFQSGFANYLEVINAQEDALRSELELVDLKRQLFLANIELYRSLGGGWK